MDVNFLLLLQGLRNSWGEPILEFFRGMSYTTDAEVLLLIVGVIYWCINKKLGFYIMQSLVISRIINGFIKISFCIYRPWIRSSSLAPTSYDMSKATGYSFPSGHASNGTVFYGALAFRKNVYIIWKVLVILLIASVCFSRMYLGVHTPQDIIVGVLVGVISIFLSCKLIKFIDNHPKKDVWVCLIGLSISLLLAVFALCKGFPIDYDSSGKILVEPNSMIKDCLRNVGLGIGFFIGWILERRLIRFNTDVKISNKIIRFIVCVGLYYGFTFILSLIITNDNAGLYVLGIKNLFTVFYIICLAPLVIKLIDYCFIMFKNMPYKK